MAEEQKLNEGQQEVADKFFAFLFSNAKTFVISGGAGVGKTFLTRYLCNTVMSRYEDACKLMGIPRKFHTLGFTATTNKAAEVLEASLGLPVQTIHSYLSLRVRNDFKTGKSYLTTTPATGVREGQIVFIDECSMVASDLYDVILQCFPNSKIVFVGDHAQLAPVGEEISRVFTEVDPENYAFLEKPVRNAGQPALMALCAQLRNTVETGVFAPIVEVPGVIDYLTNEQMPQVMTQYFSNPEAQVRTLCYSNDRVKTYNEFIREDILRLPPQVQVGDILVSASTAVTGKQVLNVEREVEILNLSDPKVDDRYTDFFPDANPILYREAEIKILSGSAGIMKTRIPDSWTRVDFMIKKLAKAKSWPEHFELKEMYADLRDKASCTVYKSQGSTYEAVFVDIGNIGTSFDASQVARMLYVAISRATTRVFLYGHLPNRYIGAQAA